MKKVTSGIFSKLMFNLRELYNDLPFLPEIMKIAKVEKLVVSLHDKSAYVIHIKNLK